MNWIEKFGLWTIRMQANNRLAKWTLAILLAYAGAIATVVYIYGRTHR